MLANNNEKSKKYYFESIARGAPPIFSVMPAVREGYGHMKQTETEALENSNQIPEGDETGFLKLFRPPK